MNASYPEDLVAPMRAELNDYGFINLMNETEVEQVMGNKSDSLLIVINSVCGCSAANARPGVIDSLNNSKKPEKLYTVFAGMEKDAINKLREYLLPYPPSSPSIALFNQGKLVHFIERWQIEGRTPELICENLKQAYQDYC